MSLLARLSEQIDDDGLSLPRGLHHVVKVLTGALVLAGYLLLIQHTSPVVAAAVCAVVWFLSGRIEYALDHRSRLFSFDLACDTALHVLPLAALIPDIRVAGMFAVLCLCTYLLTVHDASP